ncbi:hypothetical protein HN681_03965 [archaeon]|jgi:hypothetical protein|nr:hypothetical protein [archaeon]MBT3730453.1 hypothetical protein [archaeon]MBT4670436.1 hypothetical protein [archaeon]MBT5030099.1 hypothetical protein [archaeon]MBT5288210.1 hypothetical protein [archaeon]
MKKSDKIFLIPIILFSLNLIYRLIDTAKIIKYFPLDYTNDLASYVAQLSFLDAYGLFANVPNWYNGFILFQASAPGWALFTLPILNLTNNIMLSTYLSIILLYILAFISIYLIGKHIKISKIKTIALYLFIFANPMAIGGFLKQGRLPELTAFVVFIYIFYLALYYKDNPIDWKILFLAPLYTFLIISHQPETVLGSTFLLGLILTKNFKENIKIISTLILGTLLSSFWLIQFLQAYTQLNLIDQEFGLWLLDFNSFLISNLILTGLTIALLGLFYFYQKDKKDFLFFLPTLTLAFLVLTRLITFIPIYKEIYPDPWTNFLILFTSFFLVSLNYNKISKKIKTYLLIVLALAAIAAISYNMLFTPFFQDYTQTEYDILAVMPDIEERFLILGSQSIESSYPQAYYSYAALINKNTASGWSDWSKDKDYINLITNIGFTEDCDKLVEGLNELNVLEIIALNEDCTYLTNTCNFQEKTTSNQACLLSIE